MKAFYLLPAIALLAACATPQEACINRAYSEIRAVESRIAKTRSDIDRGYAVHRTREPITVLTECEREDGSTYPCERVRYETEETPVALDIAQERVKLRELEDRLEVLRDRLDRDLQQCRAAYPS